MSSAIARCRGQIRMIHADGAEMAGTKRRIEDLAEKITELLRSGIVLGQDVLFFAESTYGLLADRLADALQDHLFEERDTLLALMFFPSMQVRLALEPLLDTDGCSESEVQRLDSLIFRDVSTTDFILPDGGSFTREIEPHEIGLFVDKLYLTRAIDAEILAALTTCFTEETVLRSRLALRCREDSLTGKKLAFICRFIEKSGSFEQDFLDLFALALSLLSEIADDEPIEPYFLKCRRTLSKTLKDIREFARKRDHYPMEYLMMQRYQVPHESEEQTLKKLQLLTTITDTILGLPADPSVHPDCKYRDPSGSGSEGKKIFRVFS